MSDGCLRRAEGKPQEECGVFGIFAPGEDVARTTFFALYALQHRGQESAGIATGDGERVNLHTRMGLVAQAFDESDLARLKGFLAIGHTRYSTTGSSKLINACPVLVGSPVGDIAVAHNGNLVNSMHLREELEAEGIRCDSTTDSEILAKVIASSYGRTLPEKIARAMPRMMGAFSLTIATPTQLIGVRDPLGVRPLCIGRLEKGWAIASESCALQTIGAEFLREIEPGEIVVVDEQGVQVYQGQVSERRALCVFEYIYFARPDSVINNRLLYNARKAMGRQLAIEHPADADLVIPVPDSATVAAVGYAQESGLPYSEGLIKNRYIGRTFIQPDQRLRSTGVGLKFNPLPEVLKGKRIVVVDDSIVRGSTTKPLVRMLRQAGASEVHVGIHSPAMKFPCYLGVDTARSSELIAARMSIPEIGRHIEADSLGYLSLDGMIKAIGLPSEEFCLACFTSDYPVPVQMELDKMALEG
ncbi:MAG: amidophosphoribosyltransferase [Chloroflexi bacterium]|nr:amidophosphoribosyltransferase [Chloroflexota bacterium]